MASIVYLVLGVMTLDSCRADTQVTEYVFWRKADILAWHQYFPGRALAEEGLTNEMAVTAVRSLSAGMPDSLGRVVAYQEQELRTAQLMMEGTSAQGCVEGIAPFMNKSIAEIIDAYEDCTADAEPKLHRLYASWKKTYTNYQAAFQRALSGIDSCAKTYPNRDSISRLRTCVDTYTNNYFAIANSTQRDVYSSPSMGVVRDSVLWCAQSAASEAVSKGWQFLKKMVQCAKLSDNIEAEAYEKQVNYEFEKYLTQNDLLYQVWIAQSQSYQLVKSIEEEMLRSYDMQKRALERYTIESRGEDYYGAQLLRYLQQYYATVAAASGDHPGDYECVSSANVALNQIVNNGSQAALACDRKIVNHTKYLIAEVNKYFEGINAILPYVGNVDILSCLDESYIFAERTILNCFNLKYFGFTVSFTEVHANIVTDVKVLQGYENSFFNNASLPCGDSILMNAYLGAETALYQLQRCLYIDSGTKYAVTTPSPVTTAMTTTTATTTSAPTSTVTTTTTAAPTSVQYSTSTPFGQSF